MRADLQVLPGVIGLEIRMIQSSRQVAAEGVGGFAEGRWVCRGPALLPGNNRLSAPVTHTE